MTWKVILPEATLFLDEVIKWIMFIVPARIFTSIHENGYRTWWKLKLFDIVIFLIKILVKMKMCSTGRQNQTINLSFFKNYKKKTLIFFPLHIYLQLHFIRLASAFFRQCYALSDDTVRETKIYTKNTLLINIYLYPIFSRNKMKEHQGWQKAGNCTCGTYILFSQYQIN